MMKNFNLSLFKGAMALLIIVFLSAGNLTAQTPQFYNYNNGTVSNSFPFNLTGGKMIQTLVGPGEFNQPSGATAGNITNFYVFISSAYPLSSTYTSFNIMFSQTAITSLPTGSLYAGTFDTVYKRASVTLTAAGSTWLQFTLDHPYAYNPTQSLVIQIEQCSSTQGTGYSLLHTNIAGFNRRTYSAGGCPFAYGGTSAYVANCGVDVSTAINMVDPINMCAYTSAAVWSNFWGHASDNMGDTLYVVGGGSAGTGSTTVYRYNISSNTMGTNGAPIPESKAGHSFTRCGNDFYLIGGSTAVSTGGTTCYKYSPSTGTWTSIAPIPVAISGHVAMNWGDSVIFVVSGGWSTFSTAVYAYRPASNTWITSTALPAGTGRRSFAGGLTNGKIYVCAGYSGTFRNDLVIGTIGANASTITWATGPVVPFLGGKTGSSRPGGTAINGKFYLITGEVTPAPVTHDTIYIFNGTTNTWSNIQGGRGGQAASNYWSAVSNKVLPNGNIKIFITGGSVTGGIGQLCCLQVPGCTITGIENNSQIPNTYSLSQNYPNPFNPVTKINYALPKSGFVTMKVYDMLGKEVVNLVNENKTAGNYSIDFNASNLTSGVYFYRLEVNGYIDTKKMMLVK